MPKHAMRTIPLSSTKNCLTVPSYAYTRLCILRNMSLYRRVSCIALASPPPKSSLSTARHVKIVDSVRRSDAHCSAEFPDSRRPRLQVVAKSPCARKHNFIRVSFYPFSLSLSLVSLPFSFSLLFLSSLSLSLSLSLHAVSHLTIFDKIALGMYEESALSILGSSFKGGACRTGIGLVTERSLTSPEDNTEPLQLSITLFHDSLERMTSPGLALWCVRCPC